MRAEGSDASFFEWLMSFETGGLLKAKGLGVSPPWGKIISEGVQSLQTRIQQLAEHGIIALHLDDLLNLADNGAHPTVRFTSRYGTRRLPIAGLFSNIKEENERTEKARSWAAGILNEALAHTGKRGDTSAYKTTIADIRDGLVLARKLRDAWKSQKVLKHLAFSRSLADARHKLGKSKGAKPTEELTREELTRLKEYAASYGVTDAQLLRDGRSPDLGDTDGDLRAETTSGSVKRWAVLFTIVRLACIAEHAHRMGHEITVSDADVYLSLFPIAKVVPCFLHSREAKNQVYQYLKRIGKQVRSGGDTWGNIGISVPDILEGYPWNGEYHGVFPFERTVLQWLAAQFGFGNRAEWRPDSTLGRILLGRAK